MSIDNGATFPVGASEAYIRSKSEAVEELADAGDRRREAAEEMLANTVVGAPAETRARVAAAIEALRPSEYELPVGAPTFREFVEREIRIQVRTGYYAGELDPLIVSDALVSDGHLATRIVAPSGRMFGLALWGALAEALDMIEGDLVKPGG